MFLAHINSVKPNSYYVLDQFNKKKVLVNSDKFKLISNICPHQNSLISSTDGSGIRVCPYHNWSFTIDGQSISSGRTEYYCKNKINLKEENVYLWNGLLLSSDVDFYITENFDNMVLIENRIDVVKADYRIIMDLFLDVDHIPSVHKGVYDKIGITNLNVMWSYYNNGNVQKVDRNALWIAIYPYTMIEWQYGALFITVAIPNGNKSNVHIFKYTDKQNIDNWKLNEDVWETAWLQDKTQAELITEFPKHNLETQKIHFRNFLKENGIN